MKGANQTIPVVMTGSGGGDVTVIVNVDVEGGNTTTSQQGGTGAQDYKQLGKMISNSVKAELMNQMRPGGLLA